MIKMNYIVITLLAASISVAHAQTANQPVSQGKASVEKNLEKNPDNKGLQTADEKLQENEAKIAAKRAEHKDAKKEKRKEEKHERMEREEKMERPAKPERPVRPERPAR